MKKINKNKYIKKMIKNVSVDAKSTLEKEKDEKEKNINEKKNKEYEAMRDRVCQFKVYEHLANKEDEEDEDDEDEEDDDDEEEYNEMENEVTFYLKEDTTFRISAIGKWRENSRGEIIGDADIYFYHITTGQRCKNLMDCFQGWSEQNEEDTEKWETLCHRIEACSNLKEIILNGNTIDL